MCKRTGRRSRAPSRARTAGAAAAAFIDISADLGIAVRRCQWQRYAKGAGNCELMQAAPALMQPVRGLLISISPPRGQDWPRLATRRDAREQTALSLLIVGLAR